MILLEFELNSTFYLLRIKHINGKLDFQSMASSKLILFRVFCFDKENQKSDDTAMPPRQKRILDDHHNSKAGSTNKQCGTKLPIAEIKFPLNFHVMKVVVTYNFKENSPQK